MAQLLLFSVDTIRAAVMLDTIQRVIRIVRLEQKNDGRAWDAGSINLHGKTIPVISVRGLFGLTEKKPRLTDVLIIVRNGEREAALWADATIGVQEIPLSSEHTAIPAVLPDSSIGIETTADGIQVIRDISVLFESDSIHNQNLGETELPEPHAGFPTPGASIEGEHAGEVIPTDLILAERAKKLACPDDGETETKTVEILRFRLAYREYAIEMEQIREVILTGEITPVPGTPDFISGICIVRGEIISLVDLRVLLGIPEKGLTDLNRVIVLTDKTITFGILADHITGIGTIELNQIIPGDPVSSDSGNRYIKGVADKSLVVLDTRALLSDPRMIIDET